MGGAYLRLSDGTTWPNPLASNDDADLGWMLTYAPEQMTRPQQLRAASIVSAYGYLLLETDRQRRDQVCRDVRRALTETARAAHTTEPEESK